MINQAYINGLISKPKAHFILVPLMAQGHMIPMVDMAHLLAHRGVTVTLITTPVNAIRIKPAIDRAKASRLDIHFVELDFPCTEAGLPDGCESLDLVTRNEFYIPFYEALSMLRKPLELYLRSQNLCSACIISDSCHYWMSEVARELKIPRLVFQGPSCFYILCSHIISEQKVCERVKDESEADTFVVPDLSRRIEVTKAQAPGSWFSAPGWEEIRKKVEEAEATADGIVINTFLELEPEYIDLYRKAVGKIVLPLGPLSLYNKDVASKSTRGNKAAIDEHHILSWLETREPKSVVYVNFGSLIRTGAMQLIEIGCFLEMSDRPFIWVIKKEDRMSTEFVKWMSEGFEGRTRGRGLVIVGWAPQVLIMSHCSVGGFVTHCGWNSMLEAVSLGVPMVTWPHIADQFLNEKLVVEVLGVGVGVGVAIGVKEPSFASDGKQVWVRRDELERAASSLMDGGEEGRKRRERARVLGEKARVAMEEGGSSYKNLTILIKHASDHAN